MAQVAAAQAAHFSWQRPTARVVPGSVFTQERAEALIDDEETMAYDRWAAAHPPTPPDRSVSTEENFRQAEAISRAPFGPGRDQMILDMALGRNAPRLPSNLAPQVPGLGRMDAVPGATMGVP
jgi:hypothetical protein